MKRLFLVGYLICYFSIVFLYSQSEDAIQSQYKFKYLSVDQGLSNNNIRSICQDSKGFIWIATENGLNKFDGQSITTYRNNPQDSNSISSNGLFSIFLDSKNNLWIGGLGGLDLYNSDFDNFTRFSHKDINGQLNTVDAVVEDKTGKLWIGSSTGLYSYNLNTYEVQFYSNKRDNPHGIPPNRIYRLLVDKNNNIWFSVLNEGLCLFKQNEKVFQCFINDSEDPSSLMDHRIERIYEDSKGNIWLGTLSNGLILFVPENSSFVKIIPDPDNSYSTRVRAVFKDLKGNFFIGTRAGLYIRNDLTNTFKRYAYEGHNFSSLSQNSIICSFIDKSGTLWIGTFAGGVNYTNLNKKEFIHYSAGKNDTHYLNGANIYAITEDSDGNLWIGGDNGLNFLDRSTHTFKYYTNNPDDQYSLSYNDTKALEWDKNGNLWVGTNKGGLNYLNVETGKFKSYMHDPNNPNSIAGNQVFGLFNDTDNNLWIIINARNNFLIDILPNGSKDFIHQNIRTNLGIDQDENGNIYLGGINGFWIFSKIDSTYDFISNDTLFGEVNTIRKDSKGNLWIGSDKGLVRYSLKEKSFKRFSEDNGYPINEVFGVLEDETKSLWVSTNNGLIKLNNIVEDINNSKIRVFNSEDGLQSKQFNFNAYYKCKSGEMAFGGINGISTFFPEKIIEDTVPPDVILTDLKIFNTSVPIGKEVEGRVILEKNISSTDEIILKKRQNVFTLEFASLQNASPEKDIFKFKLEGFDKEWKYRKAAINFVTYTNLSPGEYTFIITASNNDGVWNEANVHLKITILPPWWETFWFRAFGIILIIGSLIGFYYYRLSSLEKQKLLLTQLVNERTAEIEKKNNQLIKQADDLSDINTSLEERQQKVEEQAEELHAQAEELSLQNNALGTLNATKDKFFSIIAHDLKNPFSSIMGFCEILLLRYKSFDEKKRLHLINSIDKSAQNIYRLLENLLQWSRSQTGNIKYNPEEFLLNEIIQNITNLTSNSLAEKKLNLINLIPEDLKIYADKNMIYTVIRNLVTNAIKFSEDGDITIEVIKNISSVKISVIDQGVGISDLVKGEIFEIQKSQTAIGTKGESGTGLGLIICKDFVEMHNGIIGVESELGLGSTFFFTIPNKTN